MTISDCAQNIIVFHYSVFTVPRLYSCILYTVSACSPVYCLKLFSWACASQAISKEINIYIFRLSSWTVYTTGTVSTDWLLFLFQTILFIILFLLFQSSSSRWIIGTQRWIRHDLNTRWTHGLIIVIVVLNDKSYGWYINTVCGNTKAESSKIKNDILHLNETDFRT